MNGQILCLTELDSGDNRNVDRDGDGFTDAIESKLGTDPDDPARKEESGALSAGRTTISLKFNATGKDGISSLPLDPLARGSP